MAHTETRVIAKVIVVDAHDQILLLQRSASDSRRPLQWDIPGGHVDADELIEQTAVRETAEETGLTISMEQLQLISTRTQMVKLELNVNWLFFMARIKSGAVTVSSEHLTFQWASLDEAIELIEYNVQREVLMYVKENGLL